MLIEKSIPSNLMFTQSSTQAFYFFDIGEVESRIHKNLNLNYLIVSRCNNTVTGYRRIKERYIDVPVMGNDNSSDELENYCEINQTPNFYVYDIETQKQYTLNNYNISGFTSNSINKVNF